jgi:hypothetical protein
MAAHVRKGAELFVLAAGDEDLLVGDARREEVAGARDPIRPADKLPRGAEDPGLLHGENRGIRVQRCRKRRGSREPLVDGEVHRG